MVDDVNKFNFKLTPGERGSGVWRRIEEQLEARLDAARKRNDGNLPLDETNRLRGEIKCLKDILSFGSDFSPGLPPDEKQSRDTVLSGYRAPARR